MRKHKVCEAVFVFGTSAELIKLWPLITDFAARTDTTLVSTNQQPLELSELYERLEIGDVIDLRDRVTGNLVARSEVPRWAIVTGFRLLRILVSRKRKARALQRDVLVIVHGDTMTCLLGAAIGRIARCQVAHIEAGLRSHDWRNPFPEEIDRVLTARLAHFHFCPDNVAIANLEGRSGIKIDTQGNTSRDSMSRIRKSLVQNPHEESYVLVSLHRAELLASIEILADTVKQLISVSQDRRVVMVIDSLTREALASQGLDDRLSQSRIDRRDKMAYPDFLSLVLGAERVVTDSGGLQEECGFLAIPCLVHRKATERFDGIGTTARLSMWKPNSIVEFCAETVPLRADSRKPQDGGSPTGVIVWALEELGVLPS